MNRGTRARRGWSATGWAIAYWACAGGGAVLLVVAWLWMGLSFSEEMTEQCKALAASTTMAGFGFALGVVPLLIVHAIALPVLGGISIAGRRTRRSGIIHALVAVTAPSAIGFVLTQIMLGGMLFSTGAASAACYPDVAG